MIRIFTTALALSLCPLLMQGQITGVQTVPGSFPTLTAAINALNTSGVGAGGATINVAAGYNETLTASLTLTMTSNAPSALNPLVIQKSGSGANPVLTGYTGTSTTLDGIFILNGVDYVTINGIDVQENVANATPTTQMEFGYALLKTAGTNGTQNNTIKNCTVTLNKSNPATVGIYIGNHTTTSTTAITVSSFAGTSSFNKFYNNTVQSCYNGISFTGYSAAAPYDLYDQGNQIGVDGSSTRRNQVVNFGGAGTTAQGVVATNQNNIKIFNTYINGNIGAVSTGTLSGINLITGTNSNVDIYNDTVTLTSNATTSTVTGILNTMGATGAGSTINIYNNVVDACNYGSATSGIFRGINSSATASYTNIYGNKVTNNILGGTGDFAGIYFGSGSATLCQAVNYYNNIISGNVKTGASGIFYCIYASSTSYSANCYNNQFFSNTATASASAMYGYYNFAFSIFENVYNNSIHDNTGGSGEVIMIDARTGSGPTDKNVYGNTIYNITGNSATGSVGAIRTDYGTLTNVYKNNIYNIVNNTTTGITPAVFGITSGLNVNAQTYYYNNFISELKAPSASNTSAVYGIWLQGAATSMFYIYNNTVYLNATSTGANFGTAALFAATTSLSDDIRNNILVNVSTATGTGLTRAFAQSSTALQYHTFTSGSNCLYAGTPSATNLIHSDGSNNDQTLLAFKNRFNPREQSSFSSLPPFVNVAVSPYDLHLQSAVATQCESGGRAVSPVTTDYDGGARSSSFPDVGADEISGVTTDIAAPDIQYTLLTNSGVAPTRSVPSFATITDPSGINTTVGTRPRLYYKKSTNANTYNNNTSGTDGWKYVEATNTTSPFSFTINYSLLFGGTGVANGDIIQYFVVAQDLAGTPIVGQNAGAFTTTPSSVNLTAANFPINNTLNQYNIIAASFSGTINVGPAELITSLTNLNGIFQAINNAALSGNLIINITGDLTAETGTYALNQWAEEGAGGYTITIVPSAAVTRNIYGSNTAAALIRFDGADRVTIDGRFGGTGTYLMFRNTSNSAPTIGFINDAQNNTVQYCVLESGNTSTSSTLGGTVLIGTTTGPNGNDNITISNCDIRDRSDVAGTPNFAINGNGTTSTPLTYNNNCTISNNNIHDWFTLNGASQFAINIGAGCAGFSITGNSFYQTATRTHTAAGAVTRAIQISNALSTTISGGYTVSNNFIGGTAPGATGSDWVLSGGGFSNTFGGISITTGFAPCSIQGNVIRKIDYTTVSPAAAATMWFGISLTQGVFNVGTTTGNTIGDPSLTGSLKITINAGGAFNSFLAGILASGTNSTFNLQNNTIAGITISGSTVSGGIVPQWVQVQGTPANPTTITGNTIGSTTVANSIQNNITGATHISFAIRAITNSGPGFTISNNTIQNITDNSTSASSADYGILAISTVGSTSAVTVNNNIIRDISIAQAAASPVLSCIGISLQGYGGTAHDISGNTIGTLSATNTGAFNDYVIGIQVQGNSAGGTISRNRIFGMTNVNTGASPGLAGMYFSAGLNWTVSNNMISMANGTNTNTVDMMGIGDVIAPGGTLNCYYNSIYLGGGVSGGALNSACYNRYSNGAVTMKNNLFYNKRTGGTGYHVAISNATSNPGWNVSTNNAFVVSDTTKVAGWLSTAYNMSGWRSISGGDANSIWETSATVTNAALFVNANTGNLHINTSTFPEALATPVAGISTDYDGNSRSATYPTIGADELPCSAINFSLTSQTNISCNGATTGAATVSGTGGNGITYTWSPSGGSAATATGLSAGTYTVNITNICGSTGSVSVTITQPSALSVTSTQSNVTCNSSNNGSATVSVSGGTPGYSYLWAPSGGTAATASGLAPGTYTCTITDANTCSTTQSFTITEPSALSVTSSSQVDVTCNGASSGSATVVVSGGTPSYGYSWAPSGGSAATASSLVAGTYTCTITDGNSCSTTQSFTITEPTPLSVTSSQTNVSCSGGTNGDATVSVSGGTPTYTYSWAPSGGNAGTASNLSAGTYTCTITDANSCSTTQSFTITEPTPLSVTSSQTNVSCNGGTNGDATVSVSGGTPTYTYSWAPSGGNAGTASNLTAGTYTCTITDANNCTVTESFTITEPAVLAASVTTSSNPTTCGGADGAIDITVSGGTTAYAFTWSNSASSEDLTGLSAGSYSCSIADANGCTTTVSTIVLNDPTPPTVTLALPIDTACQTTLSPFTLTGESPAGGTFSGPGVTAGVFDPMQANLGFNVITYTFTDVTGCTGTAIDSIWVDICNGIGSVNLNEWTLYPNPTSGLFSLTSSNLETGDLVVEIFTADGRLVSSRSEAVMNGQVQLSFDLSNEASGVYFIRMINNKSVRTTRVVRR